MTNSKARCANPFCRDGWVDALCKTCSAAMSEDTTRTDTQPSDEAVALRRWQVIKLAESDYAAHGVLIQGPRCEDETLVSEAEVRADQTRQIVEWLRQANTYLPLMNIEIEAVHRVTEFLVAHFNPEGVEHE